LVARASASDSVFQLRAVSYDDPHTNEISVLADRQLTPAEWSNLWATISDFNLTELRVIPVPAPRPQASLDGESTLFEIRKHDKYYVAVRGAENMEPALKSLLSTLSDLTSAAGTRR